MRAHVVYSAGEWKQAGMDGNQCDRHPSARAKARVLLPSLGELYWCNHCANEFEKNYAGEFHIQYETVTIAAS